MSAVQFFLPHLTATVAGIAQPGAQFEFLQTGTTTPLAVYSDSGLTVERTNPVVCNGVGALPATYLDNTKIYRLRIYDKHGALIDGGDIDPFIPGTVPDASVLQPYADNAAASASSALASKNAAATSETNAGNSATAAASSASAAAGSASAAAGSATSAAAALAAMPASVTNIPNATAHASDRSALAILSTSGGPAYLHESGREGTFVWSSADNSTNVTNDPQQGIYVAPASDTSGASGAWVRKYVGPVHLGWFGGGTGAGDNKTAFDAISTLLAPCEIKLGPGTYNFSQLNLPTAGSGSKGIRITGSGRASTTINITGDGGGAPSIGTNGGVTIFGSRCAIEHATISFSNSSLQCLLNIGGSGNTARVTLRNVDIIPGSGIGASNSCIGACFGNLTTFSWVNGTIGGNNGFKQGFKLLSGGLMNACRFEGLSFQPNAENLGASVYSTANPQVDLNNRATQGLMFINCNFENGPNGVWATGNGDLSFHNCWIGDGVNSKNATGWLPSQAVNQGDYIYPSTAVTATSDGSTAVLTSVSPTTALYVGMKVTGIGMGAAGANLTARITAISGTNVTLDTATATAVSGGAFYYASYAGHGYRCTTAGTTGSSQPTWPTSSLGTVSDGTVTWTEYGPCAWIDAAPPGATTTKDAITISNSWISTGLMGVRAVRATGGVIPQSLVCVGVSFGNNDYAARLDSVMAATFIGCRLNAYNNVGVELLGTLGAASLSAINNSPDVPGLPADFAIGATSNVGGSHEGRTSLTGIGASKLYNKSTSGTISQTIPGTLAITGATTASSIAASSTILSSGGGIGYTTGAGGTVTQGTDKTTAVTLNTFSGQITMNAAALAANTNVSFTCSNSKAAAGDTVNVNHVSGGTYGAYNIQARINAGGSIVFMVRNITGGSLSEAVVIGFNIVKGATS